MTPIEIKCPGCNNLLPEGASTCPECGADLSAVLRLEMEPYLLYNQGLGLAQTGDLEKAILKLRQAAAANPEQPEAYIVLGKLYAQMGDFSQARRWWEAALRRWPQEAAARLGLEALDAQQARLEAEARQEASRRKQRRWLGTAASFAGGGLLVALILLAWGAWRSQGQALATPPTTLAVVAALTPTASAAPPTVELPTATPAAQPSQTPLPTPVASPTVSHSPVPSPTPDLASLVAQAIDSHPRLAELPIQVEQQGNAVRLEGEVPSIAVKYLLEALARGVPGVELVDVSRVRVVYRVKPGDTLSEIALQMYGQAGWWLPIVRANDLANPNRIYPQQRLVIPPPD